MGYMFQDASVFNRDLSKWDVSAVTNMGFMFSDAPAFSHQLCGVAWVKSKADKNDMFACSPGSIASKVCETGKRKHEFQPQSKAELKNAVRTCDPLVHEVVSKTLNY